MRVRGLLVLPTKRAYSIVLFIPGASIDMGLIDMTLDAPKVNNRICSFLGCSKNGKRKRFGISSKLHSVSQNLRSIPGDVQWWRTTVIPNSRSKSCTACCYFLLSRRIVSGPQPNRPLIAHGHRNFPERSTDCGTITFLKNSSPANVTTTHLYSVYFL